MNVQKQFLVSLLIVSSMFSGLQGARTKTNQVKNNQKKESNSGGNSKNKSKKTDMQIVPHAQQCPTLHKEILHLIIEFYLLDSKPKSPGELCKIVAIARLVCKDFDTFCQNNYPLNIVSENVVDRVLRRITFNKFNLSRYSKDSKGRTLLHIAAMKNKPHICKSLLSESYSWGMDDDLRATAWDYAVGNDTAPVFLDYGWNPSRGTNRIYPTCPAATALIAGKIDNYRSITARESVNQGLSKGQFKNISEKIILTLRLIKDKEELDEFLGQGKIFEDAKVYLDAVIDTNNIEGLKFLIKKNSFYYMRELILRELRQDPDAFLKRACRNGCIDLVNILIDDYHQKPTSEDVMLASEYGFWAIVKVLLEKGAQIPQGNTQQNTLLYEASLIGDHEAVKLILKNGGQADINKQAQSSDTPLIVASVYGHIKVVKTLLEKGAKVNLANRIGFTALHMAVHAGDIELVRLLLNYGADKMKPDGYGETPLMVALQDKNQVILRVLLKIGQEDRVARNGATDLHCVSFRGNVPVMEALLNYGANIDQVSEKEGFTPLMIAVIHGHEAAAALLLEKGAKIDLADKTGKTALYMAAITGGIEFVKLLLEHGADQIKATEYRSIPLTGASRMGYVEIVRLLLNAAGPHVNLIESQYVKNAFSYAMIGGHVSVVRLLLDHGAGIDNDMFDWDDAINSLLGFTKHPWKRVENPQSREKLIPEFNDEIKEKYRKIYGLLMAKKAELASK
jgi:ankyrin repeat protein